MTQLMFTRLNMKKLIDIPEEIKQELQILAIKSGKDLKNYIQDLLIEKVKLTRKGV